MPEEGVVLALCYPAMLEEGLTAGIELTLIVYDVGLVFHIFPGIPSDEIHQLLF